MTVDTNSSETIEQEFRSVTLVCDQQHTGIVKKNSTENCDLLASSYTDWSLLYSPTYTLHVIRIVLLVTNTPFRLGAAH